MREKENCLILLMCWEIQIGVVHMMQMQDILGEGNGTPLLPGKSHGRRSLVGCSPWDR